jgi:hypothetical protein
VPAYAANVQVTAGHKSAAISQLVKRMPLGHNTWSVWSPSGKFIAGSPKVGAKNNGWLVTAKLFGQGGPPHFAFMVVTPPANAAPGRGYKCACGIWQIEIGEGFDFDIVAPKPAAHKHK